jgi:type II secretory pathway pseudopilin PulG
MASRKQNGFSLLELTIAIGCSLILAAAAGITMQPLLMQQHVDDAYNTTLNTLRRARDLAAGDMRVYVVTFSPFVPGANGGSVSINETTSAGPLMFTEILPPDVTYHVEPGTPNTIATTPDGFGTAANGPFDFGWGAPGDVGGSTTIFFYPDGSAHDAAGNVNNGVVYMGIPGRLQTCRAVTLWGYTGRIRGWQLYQPGGVWTWSQR